MLITEPGLSPATSILLKPETLWAGLIFSGKDSGHSLLSSSFPDGVEDRLWSIERWPPGGDKLRWRTWPETRTRTWERLCGDRRCSPWTCPPCDRLFIADLHESRGLSKGRTAVVGNRFPKVRSGEGVERIASPFQGRSVVGDWRELPTNFFDPIYIIMTSYEYHNYMGSDLSSEKWRIS